MLVIFDLDGTLFDSQSHIVHALHLTIEQLGLPARSDDECASIIGLGLKEVAQTLFSDLNDEGVREFSRLYADRYIESRPQFPLRLFDGSVEVLASLCDAGHVLAVATGKSRRGLDRVLKEAKIEHFFSASRGADETRSKPDPLMLNEILAETDMNPGEAVMVGDTSFDLKMANAVGMDSIAASYGSHSLDKLLPHRPTFVVDSVCQVLQWERFDL